MQSFLSRNPRRAKARILPEILAQNAGRDFGLLGPGTELQQRGGDLGVACAAANGLAASPGAARLEHIRRLPNEIRLETIETGP